MSGSEVIRACSTNSIHPEVLHLLDNAVVQLHPGLVAKNFLNFCDVRVLALNIAFFDRIRDVFRLNGFPEGLIQGNNNIIQ